MGMLFCQAFLFRFHNNVDNVEKQRILSIYSQQGDPEAGTGYELIAIAMVVIGGTSLMGGRGGIGLTLLGVLTIGYLDKILSINAVPEAGRLMLTGIIIVAAVLTQRRKAI
jgi:ribose transport system permease protein